MGEPPVELPEMVSRQQAADYLGITPQALSQMSVRHQGPRYVRVGRSIRYRRADLLAWIDSRLVDPEIRNPEPGSGMAQ
jgi:predicted DNA-binding transcriptional regulator AlpA